MCYCKTNSRRYSHCKYIINSRSGAFARIYQEDMAKENSMPKCANVILLGMAAKYIEIVSPEQLRESIGRVFATKGEKIVEMNQKAFDIGLNAVKNW